MKLSGVLPIKAVGFLGMGAGVRRRNRKRGALAGLMAGVVIGPLINNALYFESGALKVPVAMVIGLN